MAKISDGVIEMHRTHIKTIWKKMIGLTLLCLWFMPLKANASEVEHPTDAQAIAALLERTFEAVASGDRDTWRDILIEDAVLISFRSKSDGVDGNQEMRVTTAEDYLETLGPRSDKYLEAFTKTPKIQISGNVANAWGEYAFWINDRFSHCGIDNFSLVKDGDKWKIASLTWTVVREDCSVTEIRDLKPS